MQQVGGNDLHGAALAPDALILPPSLSATRKPCLEAYADDRSLSWQQSEQSTYLPSKCSHNPAPHPPHTHSPPAKCSRTAQGLTACSPALLAHLCAQ